MTPLLLDPSQVAGRQIPNLPDGVRLFDGVLWEYKKTAEVSPKRATTACRRVTRCSTEQEACLLRSARRQPYGVRR